MKKTIEIELPDNLACPKGYTLIGGVCIQDITPPPPIKDNEEAIDG